MTSLEVWVTLYDAQTTLAQCVGLYLMGRSFPSESSRLNINEMILDKLNTATREMNTVTGLSSVGSALERFH